MQAKLRLYQWQGINTSGARVRGKILAVCEAQVIDQLNERNVQVRLIHHRSPSSYQQIKHRIKARDITRFTRQWSTMLMSGLNITASLKLIAKNTHCAEMKSVLWQIQQQLQSGQSVSQSLKQSSRYFDGLYLDIVRVGEQTGRLSESLERIASYREKSEQLKAKVLRAAIYPCIVVMTALIIAFLMLTQVIPEFESMFVGYGAQLPWFTQQVLALSQTTQHHSIHLTTGLILTALSITLGYRCSRRFRFWLDEIKTHLPIVGNVIVKASLARFSHTLAISLNSGLPIISGLNIAARTTDNRHYQRIIEQVTQQVSTGVALNAAMRRSGNIPELLLQMIMIGEESGQLDKMLNQIANQYEAEVESVIDNLGKAIEPMLILLLGGLVGSLVIAMYLPIFNLMNIMG
ncbi:type II secretion system F family protein [Vibrio coralliilyticus]|uniref:type II secretion system F family protein n=1 Tax=Vibrio coralliilyticus TaxID=190893 RepID=UPI001E285F17|nr:type II secretion system F family protein [Vibrio coralliilyticus]MCC2522979.1 type II secretion system F family protein [Vibrio coralliilyticus]